jgi:mannose/fructose-specific phosphotransferase system component IIA
MKMLLVSNGGLANEMYKAMENFYAKPEIDVMELDSVTKEVFIRKLRAYIQGTGEEILIVSDVFGSTAFNEAIYLIQSCRCQARADIICGMSLPLVFKLYGLKDSWSIESIKQIYQEPDSSWNEASSF